MDHFARIWLTSPLKYHLLRKTFADVSSPPAVLCPLSSSISFIFIFLNSTYHFLFLLFFVFFWRKISPRLTTANPPLFAEEDWPWANIHAHLPLWYMWDAYHSMACQAVPCLHLGSKPANPGRRSRTCALNCCATRVALVAFCFKSYRLLSPPYVLFCFLLIYRFSQVLFIVIFEQDYMKLLLLLFCLTQGNIKESNTMQARVKTSFQQDNYYKESN